MIFGISKSTLYIPSLKAYCNTREIYLAHCKKTLENAFVDLATVPKIVEEMPSCPCLNKQPYVKICETCMCKILEWRLLHFEQIIEQRIRRVQSIDAQTINIAEGRVRDYKKETRKIEIKLAAMKANQGRKGRMIRKLWGDLTYLNNVLRENGLSDYCSDLEKTWRPDDDVAAAVDDDDFEPRVTAGAAATVVATPTPEVIKRVKTQVIKDAVKEVIDPLVEKVAAVDRQITDLNEDILLAKDGLNDHTREQMTKMSRNTVAEVAILNRYREIFEWPLGRRSRLTHVTPALFRVRLDAYHEAMKNGTLTREAAIGKNAKWVTYRDENSGEYLGTIIEFDDEFQKQVIQRGRKVDIASKSREKEITIHDITPVVAPAPEPSTSAQAGELVTRNTRYRRSTQSRCSSPDSGDNMSIAPLPRRRKSSVRLTGKSNLPLEHSSITKRLKKTRQSDDDTSLDDDLFANDDTVVNVTNEKEVGNEANVTGESPEYAILNSDAGPSSSNVAADRPDSPTYSLPSPSQRKLVIDEDANNGLEDDDEEEGSGEDVEENQQNKAFYEVN